MDYLVWCPLGSYTCGLCNRLDCPAKIGIIATGIKYTSAIKSHFTHILRKVLGISHEILSSSCSLHTLKHIYCKISYTHTKQNIERLGSVHIFGSKIILTDGRIQKKLGPIGPK